MILFINHSYVSVTYHSLQLLWLKTEEIAVVIFVYTIYIIIILPYIRLFTRHVLSANSSLKSCIKSTRVNFSRNPSESFKIYFICKIVSNLRDWIFHDFDTLVNIAENGCTRKKPDLRYIKVHYHFWHIRKVSTGVRKRLIINDMPMEDVKFTLWHSKLEKKIMVY